MDWEADFRHLFNEDTKFANGDSDNGWQWPENIKRDRDINNRPCLTINKTKMHVLLLANESRQNMPQARVKPVGEKVSFEAAEIWEGLLRHIQYISDAGSVHTQAKEAQLEGGIGYWLIQPDYEDDRSFNQELRLSPLNSMQVLMDCDIKRVDGSDAMWAFLFQEYDRKEFQKLFPDTPVPIPRSPSLMEHDDWIRRDGVRVAEYYRIMLTEDTLLYIEDAQGKSWTGLKSEIPGGWLAQLGAFRTGDAQGDFKERPVMNRTLQWFKIGGNTILDRRDGSEKECPNLKGRYVPIIRMPGRERVIEGKLYRAGLVRGLKDAQRMYNYNNSGEVEVVALQTKTPWIIAEEAIEGNEAAWANANTTNAAYLTYRSMADDGTTQLPKPERSQGPVPAQGFLEGLRIAAADMEMASGQYQAQVQATTQVTERTPQAVDQRKRQGELANYDFTYNEVQAIRHEAVVLIDLMPHYYDTERVVKIRADDGAISEITISPNMNDAYEKPPQSKETEAVKVLFNPKIGKYAVEADTGPSYQTQREEFWNAAKELIAGQPEALNIIGDLVFLAADWPMADKIAERWKRNIEANSPWLLDDSKTGPALAKMTRELQAAQGQVGELMTKLADAKIKLKGKDELRDIEVEDATTRRLTAEAGAVQALASINELGGLKKLIEQTVAQMLGFTPDQITAANKAAIDEQSGVNSNGNGNGGSEAQAG